MFGWGTFPYVILSSVIAHYEKMSRIFWNVTQWPINGNFNHFLNYENPKNNPNNPHLSDHPSTPTTQQCIGNDHMAIQCIYPSTTHPNISDETTQHCHAPTRILTHSHLCLNRLLTYLYYILFIQQTLLCCHFVKYHYTTSTSICICICVFVNNL